MYLATIDAVTVSPSDFCSIQVYSGWHTSFFISSTGTQCEKSRKIIFLAKIHVAFNDYHSALRKCSKTFWAKIVRHTQKLEILVISTNRQWI